MIKQTKSSAENQHCIAFFGWFCMCCTVSSAVCMCALETSSNTNEGVWWKKKHSKLVTVFAPNKVFLFLQRETNSLFSDSPFYGIRLISGNSTEHFFIFILNRFRSSFMNSKIFEIWSWKNPESSTKIEKNNFLCELFWIFRFYKPTKTYLFHARNWIKVGIYLCSFSSHSRPKTKKYKFFFPKAHLFYLQS